MVSSRCCTPTLGAADSGNTHWMISEKNTMRFALFGQQFPDSATTLLPQQDRWLHLAVTYDAQQSNVSFYVNGKLDNEVNSTRPRPVAWGQPNWATGVRWNAC